MGTGLKYHRATSGYRRKQKYRTSLKEYALLNGIGQGTYPEMATTELVINQIETTMTKKHRKTIKHWYKYIKCIGYLGIY